MYVLDVELAKAGSQMGGGLIDESGAYKGVITEAKQFQGDNGASGIELSFEREDGAKANYIKLYEKKNNGALGFGVKQIQAIMACMKLRAVNNLAELHKPVGLILQREDYVKNDGSTGFSMKLVAPFDPQTQKTAKEILENSEANTVMKILSTLKDKPAKQQAYQPQQATTHADPFSMGSNQPPIPGHDDPFFQQ